MKLDHKIMHLMRLVKHDADSSGWADVSSAVWPIIKDVPDELLEKVQNGDKGKVRLTHDGELLLAYS